MRIVRRLDDCSWSLTGFMPHGWRLRSSLELGIPVVPEILPVPMRVPGSVQGALRDAGLLPDWNEGLKARECEWVENRHWVVETVLPDAAAGPGRTVCLRALGLDGEGQVFCNAEPVGSFASAHLVHEFDLTGRLQPGENLLQIVFFCPPRALGQYGTTSTLSTGKPRFNYGWDWTSRLVQLGIWDDLLLETCEGEAIRRLRPEADWDPERKLGRLRLRGRVDAGRECRVELALSGPAGEVLRRLVSPDEFATGVVWEDLAVEAWWPAGAGAQPLYTLTCRLLDAEEGELDLETRRIGFRRIEWRACEGAPAGADPWLCVVNGRPIFLQGVNWTPIRPNFAGVYHAKVRRRLDAYRAMGCNALRVWGGAVLERETFYDDCDELGLLVWQEFPLSSSGLENWPPEEPAAIAELSAVARGFIERRQHHASLLCWCGGNELQGALDGGKVGIGLPVTLAHPLIAEFARLVAELDPERRFLPTSASGPRFTAEAKEFGQGLHWDVHGPWNLSEGGWAAWADYWERDDALFRSELGCPGASGADLIRAFRGACEEMPGTADNPLWRRTSWWIQWPEFRAERGREPDALEEFVAWSQERQARALAVAVRACKARFPRCGGVLLWMGHDSFPCTANTALFDFWGRPKPAAQAVAEVFLVPAGPPPT